jgi:hypothetical protein
MAEKETPLDEAMGLKKRGLDKRDIAEDLKNQGHKEDKISDAINQLDIKDSVGRNIQPSMGQEIPIPEPPMEEVEIENQRQPPQQVVSRPSFTQATYKNPLPGQEELIEAIVDEKWQQIVDVVGDVEIWKSRVNDELTAIKQEILRMGNRLDNVQRSVLGKVTEYNQNITDVETEIKALEKVLKNILQPLTSNIRELASITKELKKGKSKL